MAAAEAREPGNGAHGSPSDEVAGSTPSDDAPEPKTDAVAEAMRRFDLPGDRIGDIVMVSGENICIGTSEHRHDLAALKEPLRSHGGLTEQEVPFIVNRVIDLPAAPELRNFDAFFYATMAAAL